MFRHSPRSRPLKLSKNALSVAPGGTDAPARPFEPQAQAVLPIQAIDAFMVHHPTPTPQQNVDPKIPV